MILITTIKMLSGNSSVYGHPHAAELQSEVCRCHYRLFTVSYKYNFYLFFICFIFFLILLSFALFHLGASGQHCLGRNTNARAYKKAFTCTPTPLISFALSFFLHATYCFCYCCNFWFFFFFGSSTPPCTGDFSPAMFVYCLVS